MKRMVLYMILSIVPLYFNAQDNKNTTQRIIKLSSDISLLENKVQTDEGDVVWSIDLLSGHKKNELDRIDMRKPSYPLDIEKFPMIIPFIIDAMIDNQNLYLFAFEYEYIYFYHYDINNTNPVLINKFAITEKMGGSVMNYGGYVHDLKKEKISNDYYIYLRYGRTCGQDNRVIYRLNTMNNKIVALNLFPENKKGLDSRKTSTINMETVQNEDTIKRNIKEILESNKIRHNEITFKYLGYINNFQEDTTLFFYQNSESEKVQILYYQVHSKKWFIGNYSESEVKPTLRVGIL